MPWTGNHAFRKIQTLLFLHKEFNMNIYFRTLSLSVVVFTIGMGSSLLAESPEEKGLRIAREVDLADVGFGDYTASTKMTLTNKHGQSSVRLMRNRTLEGTTDGDKALIIFDNPRDVKGSAVLTWTHKAGPDDQWLYLPALKRVKRISSKNKSGPFMGSEFAYEDLASQEVEKYSYRFLNEEKLEGHDCYVLERDPVDVNSGYSVQKVWIRQDRLTQEKVEFYDRKKSLLKTLTFKDYKQYLDKFWRANSFLMINHQKGKKTLLEWQDYAFKTGLTEKAFHQSQLKKAR
jgi:hypothetical protein